jgi:hypothetical protein
MQKMEQIYISMKQEALLIIIGDFKDLILFSESMEGNKAWKFKLDGDCPIHVALFEPVADGRAKTQSLVQPFLVAFKIKSIQHRWI